MEGTVSSFFSPLKTSIEKPPKQATTNRKKRPFAQIRASNPRNGSQVADDDIKYVLKLGGGSMAGAAVIKYGSVILPQITRPNLAEALVIIATPVLAAVLLLLGKSNK